MAKDLLFELGMEEIPARFVRAAMEQLEVKMSKALIETRIAYSEIEAFATPRRIAVIVRDLADRQDDLAEEVKGPSRKIALDEQGGWSKAAQGFIRSQGVEEKDVFFRELAGVEYIYAARKSLGTATAGLLSNLLEQVVSSLSFPKNMRWGSYALKFVRPIRWMVALYGTEIVPLEIAGIIAGNITRGHRFLGKDTLLASPSDYINRLREQFVVADVKERRQHIVTQLEEMGLAKGWCLSIKEDLLEEVLFLVEYPTALHGSFDPDFLIIPQDVLITSMREHQRYFPVLDQGGKLLPHFVTVRNGDALSIDQVAKGNEKVLRARLSDARFFYQEDQKMTIDFALNKLESVVYHEGLGTIGDKIRRIGAISAKLASWIKIDRETAESIQRAAAICKFDLVTQMVYEFPELQGIMGEDYARKFGESESVAAAVKEHYQPRYSGDQSPSSKIGAIVSIADKMDSIVGCFSLGIIPTGSQDPYALRRQAAGVVQILLEHALPCKLSDLFNMVLNVYAERQLLNRSKTEISQELSGFFALRIRNVLSDHARYDVVDAIMAGGFEDINAALRKCAALMEFVQSPEVKSTLESFNRVNNLAAKSELHRLNSGVYEDKAEHQLHDAWTEIHSSYLQQLNTGSEEIALESLRQLREPITQYFAAVMIMTDNEILRNARLALLYHISADLQLYADFQKIVL